MEAILKKLDSLRVEADLLIQLSYQLNTRFASQDNKDATRSLKMGKSWLGKLKGSLGNLTPYVVVENEKQIPKTAEVFQGKLQPIKNRLDAVNSQRDKIRSLTEELSAFGAYKEISNILDLQGSLEFSTFKRNASNHFTEARFFYGFDLATIRESFDSL